MENKKEVLEIAEYLIKDYSILEILDPRITGKKYSPELVFALILRLNSMRKLN